MERSIELNLIRLLKALAKQLLPLEQFDGDGLDLQFMLYFLIKRKDEIFHLNDKTKKKLIDKLYDIIEIRNQYAHIEDNGDITTEKELHDLLTIKFFVEFLGKLFPLLDYSTFLEDLKLNVNLKINNLSEIYNFPEISNEQNNEQSSTESFPPLNISKAQPEMLSPSSNDLYAELFMIDPNKSYITESEARERLINLRGPIVHKYPTTPREEGILRRSLIDLYIKKKITTEAAFHRLGNLHIDPRQIEFLPQILDIISKINYKTI
jgi:hypothetical protein